MTPAALFHLRIHKLLILGAVTVLAACGGGGNGGAKSSGQVATSSVVASSVTLSSIAISSAGLDGQVASSSSSRASSLVDSAMSSSVSSLAASSTFSTANSLVSSAIISSSSADSVVASSAASSLASSIISSSSVSSLAKDTTPNAFSFTAVTNAALNATITSPTITISGIDTATPISITGGQYAIGNGAPTSNAGTITNGQTLTLTLLASTTPGTTNHAVLTIGDVLGTFSVTTLLADTTPDAFSFTEVTDSLPNTAVTSNLVTVSGINTAVPISITNGQYSIDGGAFTSAASTISNGQILAIKTTSAASTNSTVQAVVTLGGAAGTFSVTTYSAYLIGGAVQGHPLNIATVVTTLAGTAPNADGIGSAARFDNPNSAVSDGTNLYIADTDNHSIRKIVIATGVVTTLAGSGLEGRADGTGTAASFYSPRGITSDGVNLYISDSLNHKIRKIVIATGAVTTLAGSGSAGNAEGTGTAASFNYPAGITSDGTNLYIADNVNNSIRKIVIATGVVTTLAGSGSQGSADGVGAAASFYYPTGITNDGTNLYISDTYNHAIRKIVIATGVVTTLAGGGSWWYSDGTGTAARFSFPFGITSDGTNLFVADTNNYAIRKIVIATGVVTTLAGRSQGSNDGTGTAASFSSPKGITSDGTNLYITDGDTNTIRKIVIATGAVTTLAGSSSIDRADGTGMAARFNIPTGITSDGTNLYIADTYHHSIRKIVIATGVVTTLAGGSSSGSADGTGASANFDYPRGITSDGINLYVADTSNHAIRKIVIATGVVTTLAGSESRGYVDGTGAAASFDYPRAITSDGTNLYVADTSNHAIRKIVIATGVVTTLAGRRSGGAADGTGTEANFANPCGITSDGANLYIADTYNHSVRKIVIATGVVTTLAGGGSIGSVDGTGTAARFNFPSGITSDGTSLYITDGDNNSIRKIVIATGVVTTLSGSGAKGHADGTGAAASFDYPSGITSDGFELFVTDANNNTIRKIH